ncbi:MAG: LPS export ABC transporter periplasmic protein LptC [Deltaproteobacteria bacterium]|nr:MAG: LPS export ABC transporter periplasmic protein LptC [Deltaproteobacteria bacterium]
MKRFVRRYWPVLGLVFMVLVIAYYIVSAPRKVVKKANTLNHILPRYALQLQDVHYTHDDPNKEIKWELDAKKVRFSKDRSIITFSNFHLIIHSKGQKGFDLKGKEGRYKRNESMLYLKGDLIAIYSGNYKLYTNSMIFNEKTGLGSSKDPVEIKGPFFHINGIGMHLDIKKKKIKVLSDVNSIIYKSS